VSSNNIPLMARNEQHDPVRALRRKRRQDAGEQASMTTPLRHALLAQYNTNPPKH
jgi:putative transposase